MTTPYHELSVQAILAELRLLGVTAVECEYYGSGDSGSLEPLSYKPDDVQIPCELDEDLISRFNSELDARHPGWEIDDGSSGRIRLDVINGTLTIDHEEYYQGSNHYSNMSEWGAPVEEE